MINFVPVDQSPWKDVPEETLETPYTFQIKVSDAIQVAAILPDNTSLKTYFTNILEAHAGERFPDKNEFWVKLAEWDNHEDQFWCKCDALEMASLFIAIATI